MKLLYVSSARIPDEWAHVTQILTMSDAFAQSGAELTLVAPRRAATSTEDPYAVVGIPQSFNIIKLPCIDLFPGSQSRVLYWLRSFSFLASLIPYVVFQKSHVTLYTREPLLVIALRVFGRRVFWEIHAAEKNAIARRAARVATHIIAISHGLRTFCLELGVPEKKISVENDGVTLESFQGMPSKELLREKHSLSQEARIVAYVGKYKTMGEAKGVDELMAAHVQVVTTNPHALLLIVGLYPEEVPEVHAKAQDIGLSARQYQLIAHVPKAIVPQYLCASDVLVMNYPNTYHYAQIMSPLKMYEYMASGVPIVSSDLPTIREALDEDNACLVAPDDTHALAAGIGKVLSDSEYAERIAGQSQKDVEAHTWKARAGRILRLV